MKAKIIEKSYYFFLLLLPLVYCTNTVDPVLIPRQIYLSVFVLLLALLGFGQKNTVTSIALKNPLNWAIVAFLVLIGIAATSHGLDSESHYVLSKQLLLFAFLVVSAQALYHGFLKVDILIKACISLCLISLFGAYYQWFFGNNLWIKANQITSFFANKNLLASFLFLCLPFLIMGLKQIKPWQFMAVLGLIGVFPVLLVLGTRTVFLAVAVFAIVLLGYFLTHRFGLRKRTLVAVTSIAFGLIILTAVRITSSRADSSPIAKKGIEAYFQRLSNNKTLAARTQLWKNSIQMWQEEPILGVGAGNWQVAFPKYGLNQFVEMSITNGWQTVQRAHNDFLSILCENGLLGLLAYLLIFGIVFYQLLYLIRKGDKRQQFRFVLILATLSGYLVIAFFDFPLERMEHQILLMLLFAITTADFHHLKGEKSATKVELSVIKYGATVIGFYALVIGIARFNGEVETVKMYQAKASELWDKALLHAQNAENRFYSIDPTSMPLDWYKGTACFGKNDFGQSVAYFESAYAQAPYQIQVILSLGTAYENYNQRQKAILCYQKALSISSNFEEARLNLAAVYYNNKQYDLAFETIDKMDIINTNKKYKLYIMPILQKEINLILTRNNDQALYKKVAEKITNSYHIFRLYYLSKQQKVSFETIVLSMKDKDIVL